MKRKRLSTNNGVALIIVVSVLAIMASLAVAFLVSSRLETVKAFNFKEGLKAAAIADAGIEHAKALLWQDKGQNGYDDYSESWHTAFKGGAIDNDGDGIGDAEWIDLVNGSGIVYGRYAVTVLDESAKVNINTAGYYNDNPLKITQGWTPFEVSMDKLFEVLGCSRPIQMRDAIISERYGGNVPGEDDEFGDDNDNSIVLAYDAIDNDADGDIDEAREGINEPSEFDLFNPYGDDQPIASVADLKRIPEVKDEFSLIERYVTAYSVDKNLDKNNLPRRNINYITAAELMNIAEQHSWAGVPEQIMANLIDYRDADHAQTTIVSGAGTYYGAEGIRINEIMIRPIFEIAAGDHTNASGPGGAWTLNGTTFQNGFPELSGIGGIWWFDNIEPGTYYLKMYGSSGGQIVGDVKVGVTTHVSMKHGETFIKPVEVGIDGRLKISIANAEVDKPGFITYFNRFELSQQPDAEYIELINVTDKEVDISGWVVDGLRANDMIAAIPAETTIEAFDYCVLAVDRTDHDSAVSGALRDNNISLYDTWNGSEIDGDNVVQLMFSDVVATSDDIISDTPSTHNTVVMLKNAEGHVVDRVTYREVDCLDYRAAERGDPLSCESSSGTHVFDQWQLSNGFDSFEPKGTPTQDNQNINSIGHTIGGPQSDVFIKNAHFANIGEIYLVRSGRPWEHTQPGDVRYFVDPCTVVEKRLEVEGHAVTGSMSGWQEVSRVEPDTNWFTSTSPGDIGTWLFDENDHLRDGLYYLLLRGYKDQAVSISIKRADGTWTDMSPPLTPTSDHLVHFGMLDIGGSSADATASQTLELRVQNASELGMAALDCIILTPTAETPGRININTAPVEVLRALPGMTQAKAEGLYASTHKPYGGAYGLGDFISDELFHEGDQYDINIFRKIANLATTRSNVFEIFVTAEAINNGKVTAQKKVHTIVER